MYKQKKGYLAGPLFNEAEVNQRKLEGQLLKEQTDVIWYNPIEQSINDKAKLPTAHDVFWGDTDAILKSDYIIADLTNNDVGVAYELGIVWTINYLKKLLSRSGHKKAVEQLEKFNITDKTIIGVASDIRVKTAGKYKDILAPYGMNQYVVGGILDQGKIVKSFKEAIKIVKEKEA